MNRIPRSLDRRVGVTAAFAVGCTLAACGTRLPDSTIIRAANGAPVIVTASPVAGVAQQTAPSSGGAVTAPEPGTGGTGLPVGLGPAPSGGSVAPAAAAPAAATGAPGTAAAGAPRPTGPAASNATRAAGAADHTPLVIGQVGEFSGIVGAAQSSAQPATYAWVKYINATGGLAGHPVVLYSDDVQGSQQQAAADVQDLVENKHAQALVGGFVPTTIAGIEPYINQHKLPVIGGDQVTSDWSVQPYFYGEGTDISAATFGILRNAALLGKTKMSIFYCIESTACQYADDNAKRFAGPAGVSIVDEERISLGQADFTSNCLQASSKGANVIFVGADGATIGRVADSCARQNYHPTFVTSALAVTNDQAANPNLEGMTITATVFPWMLGSTPAEQAYQTAMDNYAHGTVLSGATAEAWTSGMLLKAAVDRLGAAATQGPITTAMILQGLAQIRNETLDGLAPPSLNFNSGKPVTPDNCYFVASIHGGQWTAPYGNKTFCKP